MRPSSPTFGKYLGVYLERNRQLFIPKGYAHGFLTLSDELFLHYKVSNYFLPEKEIGFRWDDPLIGIEWPEEPSIISERDRKAPLFEEVLHL